MKAIAPAALALVLGLLSLLSLAQPEAPEPPDPNDVLTPSESDSTAQTIPDAPLEDYEASEQISEDLSVSFPIDI